MKRTKQILLGAMVGAMTLAALSLVATPKKAEATTAGLLAHWTFDGNANESVAGVTTTDLSSTPIVYEKGVHGQAAVFNGEDQYFVASDHVALALGSDNTGNADSFTISMWLNLEDALDTDKFILDKSREGDSGGWDGDNYYTAPYRVYVDGSAPRITVRNGLQLPAVIDEEGNEIIPSFRSDGEATSDASYANGSQWFLYTITYDGSLLKTYFNQKLMKQTQYTDGIAVNPYDLYIGCRSDLSNYYKGKLDDLRLYGRSLSVAEITALYQSGATANPQAVNPAKELVAYYKFDGDVKDATAFANHGSGENAPGNANFDWGKSGKALSMSAGKYFEVPYGVQMNLKNEYTISFWVAVTKEGNNQPLLLIKNPSYGDTNNQDDNVLSITVDTWNEMKNYTYEIWHRMYNPDSWTPGSSQYINKSFNQDDTGKLASEWHHVAFTFKDGEMKLYRDGVLAQRNAAESLTELANAAGTMLIGSNGTDFFEGSLDELKIFNKCLTAAEVSTEYKRINSVSIDAAVTQKLSKLKTGIPENIPSIYMVDANSGTKSAIASTNAAVTFTSSDTSVVTVTNNGVVTGLKDGTAMIHGFYNGLSVSVPVTVKTDSVTLTAEQEKSVKTIKKGKSVNLSKVSIKDAYTGAITSLASSTSNVTFTSSNPKVFTVTNAGKIKAVANGTATLTVKYGGSSKIYTINVKSDKITLTAAVKKKLKKIKVKESYQIPSIKVKDAITGKSTTKKAKDKKVTFKSSKKAIFTVTKNGKIKGKKPGKAKLTIKYGNVSASFNVTVKK